MLDKEIEGKLDRYLIENKTEFKRLINSISEEEQIYYLNTLSKSNYVINCINNITENIIKNDVDRNPVSFYQFEKFTMSDELVTYVYNKLKNSNLYNSPYRNGYIKSIDLCKKLLN